MSLLPLLLVMNFLSVIVFPAYANFTSQLPSTFSFTFIGTCISYYENTFFSCKVVRFLWIDKCFLGLLCFGIARLLTCKKRIILYVMKWFITLPIQLVSCSLRFTWDWYEVMQYLRYCVTSVYVLRYSSGVREREEKGPNGMKGTHSLNRKPIVAP